MGRRLVSPILIGRHEELDAAKKILGSTRQARPTHLLVAGEAGIGKTRFVDSVGASARAQGYRVLRGACIRLDTGELPYAPFTDLIRAAVRDRDPSAIAALLDGDGPVLERIVPSLIDPEARDVDIGPPEIARRRLLQAILAMLRRLAQDGPVLLLVEDLHWADAASLDALTFLARNIRDESIGLVMTFRSDELSIRHPLLRWLAETERLEDVVRLDLQRFRPDETRSLLTEIGEAEPDPELVDRIQARSDGNPFFIEELMSSDGGSLTRTTLPSTLRDVLEGRIATVGELARHVLALVAVAGRRVDADLLDVVSDLRGSELASGLAEDVEHQLLIVEAAGNRARYEFRHALIQEVVYDDLDPIERRQLHGAFAAALATKADEDGPTDARYWAELAHHWDAAGDMANAFVSSIRAGEAAERAFAFEAALHQYERALTAWSSIADPPTLAGRDRTSLLETTASVAWLAGESKREIALLREAVAEADRDRQTLLGSVLRGRLGLALRFSGAWTEGLEVYREGLAMMPDGQAPVDRVWMLAGLGQMLMLEGRLTESRGLCEEAVEAARQLGERLIEGRALNTLACDLSYAGRSGPTIDALQSALAIATESGSLDDVGRGYLNLTEALSVAGQDRRALELVREGVERCSAMGIDRVYGVFIDLHGALIAYELGRWKEAAGHAAAGALGESDPLSEAYELAHTVELAVGSGDWVSADRQLERLAVLLAPLPREFQWSGPYVSARAELALWRDRPADALVVVSEGLERLERTDDVRYRIRAFRLGLRATADLAEVARARRDSAGEASAMEASVTLRERVAGPIAAVAGMDGGLALELRAELATAAAEETRLRGVPDPAVWRAARLAWRRRGRPYHEGYTRLREGEAALALGDRPNATKTLIAAFRTARALGARPLLEAVVGLARRGRIALEARPPTARQRRRDVRGTEAGDPYGLSPREREVLDLIARGLTNRQIASGLFISENTAGVHVSRILGKLGVARRTEAAAVAYRLGMTGPRS